MTRSDGEFAIKDLLGKLSAMRASETILESAPKGDSKANGRAERAVQEIEKQTRNIKLSTMESLGRLWSRAPVLPLAHHALGRRD